MSRTYVQVEIALPRHPKVLKLAELYGLDPSVGPSLVMGFLVNWWGYCAEFGSDGRPADCPRTVLSDFAAPLRGQSKNPVVPEIEQALRECRLIDRYGHPWDWEDYTGALLAKRHRDVERKRKVRGLSADSPRTVAPREDQRSSTDLSTGTAVVVREGSNQEEAEDRHHPGTSLVPVEKKELRNQERTAARKRKEAALELAAEIIFRYWRDRMGFDPARTVLNEKRRERIVARLRENGGDVSELLYVVDGAVKDPWTMGRDPRSTKPYNGTQTIFRDREKVEELLALVKGLREETHPYLGNGSGG